MNIISNKILATLAFGGMSLLGACRVDTLKEIKNIEPSISLVQTGSGTIKLTPDDIEVDKENLLISRTLGISYAGYNANDPFSTDIELSFDDVPDGYEQFSAGECYINTGKEVNSTTIEVPASTPNTAFYFNITKAAIDAHAGKKVAAKIKINRVSKYKINMDADSVYMLIDMNDFGVRKTDVTAAYFKNATFARKAGTTDRFVPLADWTANDAVLNSRPTGAGFDANAGKMGIERWSASDNPVLNGKIYQTFTLPKGIYEIDVQMGTVKPDRDTYLVVAEGAGLPDDTQIGTAIASKAITADYNAALLPMTFSLDADKQVSAGFLLNFDQGTQKVVQAANIKMYKIESLFD